MADVTTNYKVSVGVDDAKWQAFIKSVASLQSAFGGATKAAVESAQRVAASAQESATKQVASATKANDAIKAATERRVKAEESIENLKFEDLKEQYKRNAKAIDDLNNAKKNATEKEAKAEIQIELNKAKELQQVYRKELSERPETKKGKASDVGMLGTKREVSHTGGGALELVGIGAAIEGFKVLTEKSEEYSQAQAKLHANTDLQMKDVDEIGKSYSKTGTEVAGVAAKVAFATGAHGEELKKQTEAVLAYGIASGKSAEMVAKMMNTETGRAKIFADAKRNEAIAQQKANDPAIKAQFIQAQLMDTVGKLASVAMTVLAPALNGIMPILDALGKLIEETVEPLMKKLEPTIAMISSLFEKLAPVITELISNALEALSPILDVLTDTLLALIPPIIDIVKMIADALNPILKLLAPLIKELAGIFTTQLTASLQLFIPILEQLLPVILTLMETGLKILLPILTAVATVMGGAMKIAVTAISSVLKFLTDNIIKPLVEWFSVKLKPAIDATVGAVTAAVKAISSAVSAVKNFLGLGDDAKEAAAKNSKEAVAASAKAAQEEAARQATIQQGNEAKAQRVALSQKLKLGKISAKEEQELRDQAQEEGDQAMLAKLDAFDKKKEKQGAASAKSAKKSAVELAKEQADELLASKKEEIAAMDITDRAAKSQNRTAELVHAQSILDISKQYYGEQSKQYQQAKLKLQQLKLADAKEDRADRMADAKKATDDQLTELEIRASKENMTSKALEQQRYRIELDGMASQLAIVQHGSEEESKLLQQRNLMVVKHEQELRKEQLAVRNETNKLVIENHKEFLNLQIQQLKTFGKDSTAVEQQLLREEEKEEDNRYKEELEKRKEQGQSLVGIDGKMNFLGEQLEIQHQQKLAQIKDKAAQLEKDKLSKQFSFLVSGYSALTNQIDSKFFKPMGDRWFGQNEIAKSVFGDLTSSAIKWLTTIVEKQALALAEQLGFITTSTAATTAAGAAAAATWGPAAIAASIATLGTADVAGATAYAAAQAAGAAATLIPHAEGAVFTSPAFTRFGGGLHSTAENSPEMALPLSSSRAQSIVQSTFGFDKSLNRVVEGLAKIETHVARTKVVLPMNNSFENARNNYLKSEDRRSI